MIIFIELRTCKLIGSYVQFVRVVQKCFWVCVCDKCIGFVLFFSVPLQQLEKFFNVVHFSCFWSFLFVSFYYLQKFYCSSPRIWTVFKPRTRKHRRQELNFYMGFTIVNKRTLFRLNYFYYYQMEFIVKFILTGSSTI